MGFSSIPPVETSQFYIETAFKAARKSASQKRGSLRGDKLKKSRLLEENKVSVTEKSLIKKFSAIADSFPNFDNLPEFYEELVRSTIDYKKLKESLGAVNWAKKKISELTRNYRHKILKCDDAKIVNSYSNEYFGRIASVIKQIGKNLSFLEESRRKMREYPSIKEGLFTVAIAGFPNVGKSTVLSKVTSSKPDIQPYSFTTKTLNIGYMAHNHEKIQFIDTPGTLNRIDKMNNIEKIAYLAMKYCADMIIYVFDLTEPYPLDEQKKLLRRIEEFDKPTVIYLSKTDILLAETVSSFKSRKKPITDIGLLKEKIIREKSTHS